MLKKWRTNIRFYVLLASFAVSLALYVWVRVMVPAGLPRTIRLTQLYALTALIYLYVTLLIGPAVYSFRSLPWRGHIYRARRAIGVSTFYFACLHAYLAFFKQLGGFSGLGFLSSRYLLAIILSFTALVIFFLMTITALDKAVKRLTFRRWKMLHRFVYLAGVLVLVHALMLGTHFSDLSQAIPQISFIALACLLFLEARRFDAYLKSKRANLPTFGLATTLLIGNVIAYIIYMVFPRR